MDTSSRVLLNPIPSSNVEPSTFQPTFSGTRRTNATEIEELRHFLSTCNPPMTRYLSRFLAVGCRSIDFLRSISKLPDELLKEFVNDLPNNDDREMTYTEKIVIRAWFREYFLLWIEINMSLQQFNLYAKMSRWRKYL
ncbi:hypothetical protein BDQ17DRAFT_1539901 [Cyathus striatus]|nr:hypothetical protein BDQ17DRAFT_1539901 [Cyathus striatus]